MIIVALQKGRVEKNFYKTLLEKKIINQPILESRQLKFKINNNIELLLLKSFDVLNYVKNGYANLGVVSSELIEESGINEFVEMLDLNTGVCRFALASLPNTNLQNFKTIASKYPIISKKILNNLKLDCKILKMEGSLEIAPLVSYADAIIDIVETGETLKSNGLQVIKFFNRISTRIIALKENQNDEEIKNFINILK